MVKSKKLLSILLLILVSLTAVAATVVSNVSVSTDINNSNVNHAGSKSGTLTFSNDDLSSNYTVDISGTTSNSGITLTLDTTSLFVNTNSSSTATYSVAADQYTPNATYTYTINYSDSSNSSDTNSETFYLIVPEDKTITKTVDSEETISRGNSETFSILLNNTGNVNAGWTNISYPNLKLNWDQEVNLTGSNTNTPSTLTAGNSEYLNVTYTTSNTSNSKTEYGIYSGILTYDDEDGASQSINLELSVFENSHDSRLEITANFEDITNDDTDTYPGDIVRIEDIEINNDYTNNNDDSITDIELEYRVYLAADGDDMVDETYSETFDLEENEDSNNFDIDFQIPFDAKEGDYIIELVATGEVSSDGTDDGDEISNRLYLEFNVDKESRHMIPKTLISDDYCPGEIAELNIELVNIGTNDLDEDDDMLVRVKIPSFEYDQWHNYTENIDAGDTETTTINVAIPSNAATGNHEVKIYSRHDGNSNSNKDGSYLLQTLTLSSTCAGTASSDTTILSGQSSEEGTQGMNTKYILTVTNNGDSAVTYEVEAIGVDAWGAAVITPETLSVPAGETSTFSVYLQPGENAQSTNNAVINLKSGGEVVASKTLTLTISGMSISTFTDALFGNTFSELGDTSIVTLISLLIVLGTAGGAIWLVHGDQIRSSQKKKKRKSSKKKSRR